MNEALGPSGLLLNIQILQTLGLEFVILVGDR